MIPADGVLGIATARRHHLVKRCDSITGLEFDHVGANGMDDPGNVVPLVYALASIFGSLPVLRVGPGDDDFRHDLIRFRYGDR